MHMYTQNNGYHITYEKISHVVRHKAHSSPRHAKTTAHLALFFSSHYRGTIGSLARLLKTMTHLASSMTKASMLFSHFFVTKTCQVRYARSCSICTFCWQPQPTWFFIQSVLKDIHHSLIKRDAIATRSQNDNCSISHNMASSFVGIIFSLFHSISCELSVRVFVSCKIIIECLSLILVVKSWLFF